MDIGSALESDYPRRPAKKRSHTRRGAQDCVINMAEARREIAHCLHLHRSSSSSSCVSKRDPTDFLGNNYGNPDINFKSFFASNSQYNCYSLMDTLPTPEPVWSTTTTTAVFTTPPPMETTEFEWGDNQAASYSWWLGFLKTLDGNSTTTTTPGVKDDTEMRDPRVFGQCEINVSGLGESSDQLSSSTDDWLMFPNNEDPGERQVP
ncbi:unnamed protein product [Dovyalis caffra]|uniref:Uncharacterized protein n=1 Tax=Dovyalis caffra TaxID=77055 RepID=A0AAV1S070_9ROSI|nr:unnamed protein product [Dovyalis caffra]